ncbi:hypothetical protein A2U01_0095639, partial [Trifolium medium]|nr:hypothetical protein [Trifolium medium]
FMYHDPLCQITTGINDPFEPNQPKPPQTVESGRKQNKTVALINRSGESEIKAVQQQEPPVKLNLE